MALPNRELIELITLQQLVAPDLALFEAEFSRITDDTTPLTREICEHLLKGKSKRFRPTLLLLSAKCDGKVDPQAVTAAACVELVHTATLVHDDFIDDALTRRGLPTVNTTWGGVAALIMGDYLYSRALSILCDKGLNYAVQRLAHTTVLMSQAEMLQLELKYQLPISEEQYLRIIYQKTASLIETACQIGASFNASAQDHKDAFAEFGRKVGLVFQITDDIFDYLGDERRLGKPTGQDWEEGRITLPLIAALAQAPRRERQRFLELASVTVGVPRSERWSEVRAFVTQHDGVEYAFAKARQYGQEAKAALAPVAAGAQKELLATAVDYVINRLN
jgi:octaprenyl-diphosphate synthase